MIDLHYWTTPNGHKITIFLEETGVPYRIVPVNLVQNDQFKEEFLEIAPNNKMPAIIDHDPADGGKPISLFESGAILNYLADKSGHLIAKDQRTRLETQQWLFWQVAGLGPMAGQVIYYKRASEKTPSAEERFVKETSRLFGVLNKRLKRRDWLAGDAYSIADIAAFTWAAPYNLFDQNLDDYPDLERWLDTIWSRPATKRAYEISKAYNPNTIVPLLPRQPR
jgi:GST-like protein